MRNRIGYGISTGMSENESPDQVTICNYIFNTDYLPKNDVYLPTGVKKDMNVAG
jgi:hypothetical protein